MNGSQTIADELLVLLAQDGGADAMDLLVRRHEGALLRHARAVTGDKEAARDVCQEAWVVILRGIGRLDDPAAFRVWAYRIVTRRGIDWVRSRQRRRAREMGTDADRLEAVRSGAGGSSGGAADSSDSEVWEAMKRLSVEHRAIVSMHYVQGLSTDEIADALDIPRGTVKSRLYHARQHLKQHLERDGHERAG